MLNLCPLASSLIWFRSLLLGWSTVSRAGFIYKPLVFREIWFSVRKHANKANKTHGDTSSVVFEH